MILDAIAKLILNNSPLIPGETLFVEFMPSEVTEGVVLLIQVPITISPYTKLRRGSFQAIARAERSEDAAILAEQVIESLSKFKDIIGYDVKVLRPKHEPLIFPRSEGDLIEASVNFELVYGN